MTRKHKQQEKSLEDYSKEELIEWVKYLSQELSNYKRENSFLLSNERRMADKYYDMLFEKAKTLGKEK